MDFIPKNHEAFRTKLTQFRDWLTVNGAAFGFSPAEIGAVSSARTDQDAKLTDKQAKDLAALTSNQISYRFLAWAMGAQVTTR